MPLRLMRKRYLWCLLLLVVVIVIGVCCYLFLVIRHQVSSLKLDVSHADSSSQESVRLDKEDFKSQHRQFSHGIPYQQPSQTARDESKTEDIPTRPAPESSDYQRGEAIDSFTWRKGFTRRKTCLSSKSDRKFVSLFQNGDNNNTIKNTISPYSTSLPIINQEGDMKSLLLETKEGERKKEKEEEEFTDTILSLSARKSEPRLLVQGLPGRRRLLGKPSQQHNEKNKMERDGKTKSKQAEDKDDSEYYRIYNGTITCNKPRFFRRSDLHYEHLVIIIVIAFTLVYTTVMTTIAILTKGDVKTAVNFFKTGGL